MKKVKNRHSVARLFLLSTSLFLSLNAFVFAQEPDTPIGEDESVVQETVQGAQESNVEAETKGGDAAKGKEIFNTLCAACHKLDSKSIGPALRGVTDKRETEWLHAWIRNSSELIASGDETAVALYNEFNQVAMPPFPQLSDEDIDNILAYVSQPKQVPQQQEVAGGAAAAGEGGGGGVSTDIVPVSYTHLTLPTKRIV